MEASNEITNMTAVFNAKISNKQEYNELEKSCKDLVK